MSSNGGSNDGSIGFDSPNSPVKRRRVEERADEMMDSMPTQVMVCEDIDYSSSQPLITTQQLMESQTSVKDIASNESIASKGNSSSDKTLLMDSEVTESQSTDELGFCCGLCDKKTVDWTKKDWIQCTDNCHRVYHIQCLSPYTGINETVYKLLVVSKRLKWTCYQCLDTQSEFKPLVKIIRK